MGITSKSQINDVTVPLPIKIGPVREVHQFIVCDTSPVNLLGRDLLCKLNCTIHCTPDGIVITTHDEDADVKIISQTEREGYYVLLTKNIYYLTSEIQ